MFLKRERISPPKTKKQKIIRSPPHPKGGFPPHHGKDVSIRCIRARDSQVCLEACHKPNVAGVVGDTEANIKDLQLPPCNQGVIRKNSTWWGSGKQFEVHFCL